MSRRTAGALALPLVAAGVLGYVYFSRDREPYLEPDPVTPLGPSNPGLPAPTVTAVEYHTPAGPRKAKPNEFGFSVSTGVTTALALTCSYPGGAGRVSAKLVELDVVRREERPVADVAVTPLGADAFTVEVPGKLLARGRVYRVSIADPASDQRTTYQFNVSNAPF